MHSTTIEGVTPARRLYFFDKKKARRAFVVYHGITDAANSSMYYLRAALVDVLLSSMVCFQFLLSREIKQFTVNT